MNASPLPPAYEALIAFIQDLYGQQDRIPLHEPRFVGNEKRYVEACIDSTFVSSVGSCVDRAEKELADYTGAKYAVAVVNGTAALHAALMLAGVGRDDEVLISPLTFVASCNAVMYCGASPVFVDVDRDTLGVSPESLDAFLSANTRQTAAGCENRRTGRVIRACVPMHAFGHPVRIDEVVHCCRKYGVALVEDAAESLGSQYKGQHTGTFGHLAALSFNGNKIVTAGAGGAVLTDTEALARKAKHLTTTAKAPHPWELIHDMVGYNYRMPNLNAALLLGQLEQLPAYLENKRETARLYKSFCREHDLVFLEEPPSARSNFWLNAILAKDLEERNLFLRHSHSRGIMTRPCWRLMHRLPMFMHCQAANLDNANWAAERLVCLPSSVRIEAPASTF